MENGGDASLISQMKILIQMFGSAAEDYGDPTLIRFLQVKSMNPEKAAKAFVQWQNWRVSVVPSGFINDDEVADELRARKIFLGGPTKDGYLLLIGKASLHYPSKDHLQFKKFVVYILDKAIASAQKGNEIGEERFMVILDLHKISYRNVDVHGFDIAFQFLQLPRKVGTIVHFEYAKILCTIVEALCRFINKNTVEKIVIVNNEDQMQNLIREFGEAALPEDYGDKSKPAATQDVILQ